MKSKFISQKVLALSVLLSLCSCSSTTLSKSIGYSAGLGCVAGGAGGYALSPEGSYNKKANAATFCAVGALVSGAVGYMLYKDNPMNEHQQKSLENLSIKNEMDTGLNTIKVNQEFKPIGTTQLPQINLPDEVKGKMPTPKIYVQEVQEQRVNKEGNYIYIEPHKAYIYTTEEVKQ